MLGFLRYVRNGAFYSAVRRPPTALELHVPCAAWDVAGLPGGVAFQHPSQSGLWLIRDCVGRGQLARIRALFGAVHASGRFPWHAYEPGRAMMPLHASPALDDGAAARVLEGLEVFGEPGSLGADPLRGWPRLAQLLRDGAEGAADLLQLQGLPQEAISDFAAQRCLFIQAQALERGAEVTPHRDALPHGGDMIATLVLDGSNEVRVGSVRFRVEPGDLYAIAHAARYDVEHEVSGATYDRFSVTMRYGLDFRAALPALPRSATDAHVSTSDLFL